MADWRASLLGKGLKVNAGKSKVMVGSSGGKMIVNSGKLGLEMRTMLAKFHMYGIMLFLRAALNMLVRNAGPRGPICVLGA